MPTKQQTTKAVEPALLNEDRAYLVVVKDHSGKLYFAHEDSDSTLYICGNESFYELEDTQRIAERAKQDGWPTIAILHAKDYLRPLAEGEMRYWKRNPGGRSLEELSLCTLEKPSDDFIGPMPVWFVERMKMIDPTNDHWGWDLPGGEREAAAQVFFMNFPRHYNPWLDHYGWVGESLIFEPYGMGYYGEDGLDSFIRFRDLLNLNCFITGVSSHYPGRTIRIEVWPKESGAKEPANLDRGVV
jgi:hypothetical protein